MFTYPGHREINNHTSKLIVGLIALFLATVTNWLAGGGLESISASYYAGDWPRNIFVGSLFAISAFLLSYNGDSEKQMILSKVAALAGLCIALFPCKGLPAYVPYVHGISAAAMFLVLAYFCYAFRKQARNKLQIAEYEFKLQARVRGDIYLICLIAICLAIGVLALDYFLGHAIKDAVPRLTFYGEKTGLIAFGIAWLTASRYLYWLGR